MTPEQLMALAFQDELEKIAWGGTYYHGTSPKVEKRVLQEGLKASKGGSGSTAIADSIRKSLDMPPVPAIEKWKKDTKGRVTMSRSKTVAKMFGLFNDPKAQRRMARDILSASKQPTVRQRAEMLKVIPRELMNHQPLEIQGKNLKGLHRDPGMKLLAVMSKKDIPAELVRKSSPRGGVRKVLRRAISQVLR